MSEVVRFSIYPKRPIRRLIVQLKDPIFITPVPEFIVVTKFGGSVHRSRLFTPQTLDIAFKIDVSFHANMFWSLEFNFLKYRKNLNNLNIGTIVVRPAMLLMKEEVMSGRLELMKKGTSNGSKLLFNSPQTELMDSCYALIIDAMKGYNAGSDSDETGSNIESFFDPPPTINFEESHFKMHQSLGLRLVASIYSLFLSEDNAHMLKTVKMMYLAFRQDLNINILEFYLCLGLLNHYYKTIPFKYTLDYHIDTDIMETATFYFKYSMATYGWKGLVFFNKLRPSMGQKFGHKGDYEAIQVFLSVSVNDILLFKLKNAEKLLKPSYFVVYCHEKRSIVIAIRGTMGILDTITDLTCEYEKWDHGYVHSGFYEAAIIVYNEILSTIEETLNESGYSDIVVVGHSLGAGVGAILSIMLKTHFDTITPKVNINVNGICYASPPSLSENLAKDCSNYISTIVYGNDCVARLSYGSFSNLKEMFKTLLPLLRPRYFITKPSRMSYEAIFSALNTTRKRIYDSKDTLNPILYLPGKIFHMYKQPVPAMMTRTVVEASNRDLFWEFTVGNNLFFHHLPGRYDKALERYIESARFDREN